MANNSLNTAFLQEVSLEESWENHIETIERRDAFQNAYQDNTDQMSEAKDTDLVAENEVTDEESTLNNAFLMEPKVFFSEVPVLFYVDKIDSHHKVQRAKLSKNDTDELNAHKFSMDVHLCSLYNTK